MIEPRTKKKKTKQRRLKSVFLLKNHDLIDSSHLNAFFFCFNNHYFLFIKINNPSLKTRAVSGFDCVKM